MTRGSPSFQPAVIVVGLLGVAVFVAAMISQVVFHSGIDPTEQTFAVTLRNDTASTVVVKQCDTKCDSFHERDRLRPGAGVRVNTSSDNVDNWWAVTDAEGRPLGCLPLRYDHKIDGLVVNVSDRTRCPAGASESGSGVFGSILGFGLFFLVAGVGVTSIVFATVHAHRLVTARGLSRAAVTAMTWLAALVAVLGGWLIFDLYVVIREGTRLMRRAVVRA